MSFTLGEFWYALGLTVALIAVILLGMALYQFIVVPVRKRRKIKELLKEGEYLRRIQILKETVGRSVGLAPGFPEKDNRPRPV
jgi:peptidoglycan/LPS O-acetylase OafA/YrhL